VLEGQLMKKIDLHIHTIPTMSDSDFTFSLDIFKNYVEAAHLDAAAVTNHDIFDLSQYEEINEALDIPVFPGIEVNLEKGHVLIISEESNVETFNDCTTQISELIRNVGDKVTYEQLIEIFGDLSKYVVIPHYEKKPRIFGETFDKLKPYITAGEVDSAKKFVRVYKDHTDITPVLFSDVRIKDTLTKFPTRQTYVDCGEITLDALKASLRDKGKVALTERDGNSLWQVFDNGQMISTGLNVLLGERSSGKTYTLDEIFKVVHRVKYIKQFQLVQQDSVADERIFKDSIQKEKSSFVDQYLAEFKSVVDSVLDIDLDANEKQLDNYIESLLKSADDSDRRDTYAKAYLFDEEIFPLSDNQTLKDLISSVRQIIENIEYNEIIDKHIDRDSMKELACELIELLWNESYTNKKKRYTNTILKDVKEKSNLRTSATAIDDIDIYAYLISKEKIAKYEIIVSLLKKKATISVENIQTFRVEATKEPYIGASEVRSASGTAVAFSEAFRYYQSPYKYLRKLLEIPSLPSATIYKLFTNISYKILNNFGYPVSGGERSEFRLLQEIKDSQNYDMLLIDEPESSFDNLFLNSDVNRMINEISETMPVIVVTHNSTVGASIGSDYMLYAYRNLEDKGKVTYTIYSGHPTDKELSTTDGMTIATHEIMMNSLEAGTEAYINRRSVYEAVEN